DFRSLADRHQRFRHQWLPLSGLQFRRCWRSVQGNQRPDAEGGCLQPRQQGGDHRWRVRLQPGRTTLHPLADPGVLNRCKQCSLSIFRREHLCVWHSRDAHYRSAYEVSGDMSTHDGYVMDVAYPPHFHKEIQPVWLNGQAQFLGATAPDLCKPYSYCELGCGMGINLLIAAATNPQGQFLGVDANEQA